MKIQKKELLTAINAVISSTKSGGVPILANIKIEAKNNILSLEATDLDTWIKYKLACDCEDFATTIPALQFKNLVSKLDGEIELTLADFFEIKKGKSKYKLPTLPACDFLEALAIGDCFSFEANLKNALNKTKFAISNDITRYYLTGTCLHTSQDNVNVVATDGHKLGLISIAGDYNLIDKKIIIPKKSVNDLLKFDGLFKFSISNNILKVENDNLEYTTKLIDGEFPDYQRVLPKNHPISITLQKQQMIDCLDRLLSVLSDRNTSARFKFGKSLIIEGNGGVEELEIQNEANVETGFNVKYFLDILRNIDDSIFTIQLKDGMAPALIASNDSTFVIMPVRV
jgi:DNA polymerase III subunit beta